MRKMVPRRPRYLLSGEVSQQPRTAQHNCRVIHGKQVSSNSSDDIAIAPQVRLEQAEERS